MPKEKALSKLLLGIVELVVLIIATVSLVLAADYLVVKWFFVPVFGWSFANTCIMGTVFESLAFIFIGIWFLQKHVKPSYEGCTVYNIIMPDMARIFHPEVVHKARPMLGGILIGAGVVLFIIGMILLPIYYKI